MSRLAAILARKRVEIERRRRRAPLPTAVVARTAGALEALRRPSGAPLRVIAEVKFRSPSAGAIRPWSPGEGTRVALGYERAGAAAISVLCDNPGFGGSVLELRRVARRVERPVLFKEFVLDPLQLDVAAVAGASMVLLLVRALDDSQLAALVEGCLARGLAPVVEAADASEVQRANETNAPIIGVNARDLSTFEVDPGRAREAIGAIAPGRVRVFMSGVDSRQDLADVAATGADAALVGTGLMRHAEPGQRLAELLRV